MKKYIFIALAMLVAVSAQAQVRTSRTFIKTKSRTEWIIRAGVSFNSLTGIKGDYNTPKPEDFSVGSKTGFAVDFGFNKYFGQSNCYWGMELGVGTRGASIKEYDYDPDSFEAYNVKYSPFTLGYKFPIGDSFRVDPHAGLYASYDFSVVTHSDSDFENRFDAGLQFGAGVWFKKVNLDFMYQIGFVNTNPHLSGHYYEGGKTGNFVMRLGYAF